ncbi:histamine N-methyltransferase-like [Glandiceps talaboti]
MTELKSIFEDIDYYLKSFNLFKALLDIGKNREQWHSQWPVITKKFQFDASSEEQIRMLTIGSGEGDFECNIIPLLMKRHSKVHVKVIEPSEESVELFKQKATKLQESYPGLTCDWSCKTFEDYLEGLSDEDRLQLNEKFHLVLSGYSLYYMEEWRAAVDDMYSFVKQGGILVTTLCNGESEYHCQTKK